jgi:hypothetical protein
MMVRLEAKIEANNENFGIFCHEDVSSRFLKNVGKYSYLLTTLSDQKYPDTYSKL